MLTTTLDVFRATLKADPTVSPKDRARLLALLRTPDAPVKSPYPPLDTAPRILRRAEVANRLSLSLRTVDKLPIKKIKLPGRTRAAGFLESDINALLDQKVA
jgi:predicted DNA-binding transcriptional regulator AlpA